MIEEGDHVILKKEKNLKVFQVRAGRDVWLERSKFSLEGIIGHPFGTTFEVKNGQMVKLTKESKPEIEQSTKDTDVGATGKDNRNLLDRDTNQKLSRDEIEQLKKEGVTGDKLIEHLIENSATFQTKTEYSQEKYVKKKKQKHLLEFTVLKPTTRLLCEMHWSKGPVKICNLRLDSLAQILTLGNVRANSTVAVVDSCLGLVTGAVMERLGGFGKVVSFYSGDSPMRNQLDVYGFSKNVMDSLYYFPMNQVNSLKHSASMPQANGGREKTDVEGTDTVVDDANMPQANAGQEKTDKEGTDTVVDQKSDIAVACESSEPATVPASETRVENLEPDTSEHSESRGKGGSGRRKRGGKGRKRPEERQANRQARAEEIEMARNVILQKNFDCLIVACKFHPTPIVTALLDYVSPSRQIVVFSQFKEALTDCYVYLREHGGLVSYRLTETWLREYQVLPNRTHPIIQMSGTGGYLLTATTVLT